MDCQRFWRISLAGNQYPRVSEPLLPKVVPMGLATAVVVLVAFEFWSLLPQNLKLPLFQYSIDSQGLESNQSISTQYDFAAR